MRSVVLLLDKTLRLLFFLDIGLVLLESSLEADGSNFVGESLPDVFHLDVVLHCMLILLLHDLRLVALELLRCFLGLKSNLLVIDSLLLVLFTLLFSDLHGILGFLLINLVLNFSTVKSGLTAHILTELSLKILEE